jgi:hypothetical protein
MTDVYLRKDRQERYTLKHSWYVNAWRIVEDGNRDRDRVQPWTTSKREARDLCAKLNYTIVGEDK